MNSTVVAVIYIPSNKLLNIFKYSILIGHVKITIDVVEKRLIQQFLYISDYKKICYRDIFSTTTIIS